LSEARVKLSRLVLLAMLIVASAFAQAQPRFGLSAEAFAVYQRWVLSTCIGGDERTLALDLRRHAAELVPALRKAIAEGPAPEEVSAVRAAAQGLYERRAKSPMDDVEITGVSAEDLARFRRTSRETFVADQVRRFTTGYRANAVAALGTIGDPQSRALLTRLARNARDPLAPAAREALRNPPTPR
jgi:hypothetical protein